MSKASKRLSPLGAVGIALDILEHERGCCTPLEVYGTINFSVVTFGFIGSWVQAGG